MKTNKLTINYNRTEFMLVIKKKIKSFDVKINKIIINKKNFIKYLGILIDNKLKWKNCIENLGLFKKSLYVIFFSKTNPGSPFSTRIE